MSLEILDIDPSFPEDEGSGIRRLDYLGYAPCPIRAEMKRRLNAIFRNAEAEGFSPQWYSPGGCGEGDPYDLIWQTDDEADMPGLISDGGSSDFLRVKARAPWIDTGVYGPIEKPEHQVRSELQEADIEDPLQAMHLYATFPSLFLVDLKKLGDRPVPKSWADLLDPQYASDITFSGHKGEVPELVMLNVYKRFGEEGVRALARNAKDFWPGAKMSKTAGSGSPDGSAIYVLNLFFAKANRHDEKVALVWPEEGAWFNPLMVLGKRDRRPESQLAIDFLFSEDWARYLESVGVPPIRTFEGQSPLPGKLDWLGWDFLHSHDLDALKAELSKIFFEVYRS